MEMSRIYVSEMLAEIRKAHARRMLMNTESELNAASTPTERSTLENKHAALVAYYRRLPSVTSPGTPDPQE